MSRSLLPKQLQALTGSRTMIQETVLRTADPDAFKSPIVVSNEEHRFDIAAQLEDAGITPFAHVLEPAGRNTAAATAVAALLAMERDPEAILLIMPSDHAISGREAFRSDLAQAAPMADAGELVLFGIEADAPATGYGYIVRGAALNGTAAGYRVDRFVEKPSREEALDLIGSGRAYWNSGLFLMRGDAVMKELTRHRPAIVDACAEAVTKAARSPDFVRLDSDAFLRSPSEPIDKAVMENSDRLIVLPARFGWSDIGSWSALWEVSTRDGDGNTIVGDALLQASRNCYVRTDKTFVAAVGLEDTIIVEDGDAVLVCARSHANDVKDVVARMKEEGRRQHLNHLHVTRPWGRFETVAAGRNHQVKLLTIKPGASLSLQFHRRRSEHWLVVQGKAEVHLDGQTRVLGPTQSIDIPMGAPHRLSNAGAEPLLVVEVQMGSYLGEDDIVRLEDAYRRPVAKPN